MTTLRANNGRRQELSPDSVAIPGRFPFMVRWQTVTSPKPLAEAFATEREARRRFLELLTHSNGTLHSCEVRAQSQTRVEVRARLSNGAELRASGSTSPTVQRAVAAPSTIATMSMTERERAMRSMRPATAPSLKTQLRLFMAGQPTRRQASPVLANWSKAMTPPRRRA